MIQNIVVLLLIFNLGLISSHQIDQTSFHLCSQDHNTDCLESNTKNIDSSFESNSVQQKQCAQIDGVEACNEFDASVSGQISESNENNRNSDDEEDKLSNLFPKSIISFDESMKSSQNVPSKDQNQNEILKTDIKQVEQTIHKSPFQRGFKDSNLNKALLKHEKYLLHNHLLREYDLVVHNDLPLCSKSTTQLNNTYSNNTKQIDFFEVTNLFSGFFNLEHAIVRYEQRNLHYKMKGEYFLPFFVELYPHYEMILQKERGILRLFQEKQGGGDCILFLLNKDSFSYSSLPLSFDFHFEYVELKNKTDVNSLSNFQLTLRNAHRIAVLNTPTNLMLIDSLHCALHSFVLIGSFFPMTAYFHLGYAVCSLSLFEALFPHLAQGGGAAGEGEDVETLFLEYDFDEIAELSESRANMNMNNEKKFTYQSVMQSKQIAGYLAVTVQDQVRDMRENILKKSENLKLEEAKSQKHEMSVFKLVSTFDVHSRLTLFNVQTLADILNEPLESNGPVLAETFELADRLTKEQKKITQHKHYKLILDEKEGFCVLEKTGNVFVLAFDLIRRTFYTVIKWVADHL